MHAVNQFGAEGLAYQVGNRAAFLVGFLSLWLPPFMFLPVVFVWWKPPS